jgi:nitrous oxidase accessory protein NosD
VTDPFGCDITMDNQGAVLGPLTYTHSALTPTPAIEVAVGETFRFWLDNYVINGTPGFADSIEITVIPTVPGGLVPDQVDLQTKLKVFLEQRMGGVWTVSTELSGANVRVTDIGGIGSPGREIIDFVVQEVVPPGSTVVQESSHTFTVAPYEDPWVVVAILFMDAGNFSTSDTATCIWQGSGTLPTVDGPGTFTYAFEILPLEITLDVEIRDNVGALVGSCSYRMNEVPLGSGYQCDRRYELGQISAFSRESPTTPDSGVAAVPVIDWSGSVFAVMNNGSGPPLPPGSICVKPTSIITGDATPANPSRCFIEARSTTTNPLARIASETLTVVGFSLSRTVPMPLPGDQVDLSDWEGESVQLQYTATDDCIGGLPSDMVTFDVTVPAFTNHITVDPSQPETTSNKHFISEGLQELNDGGLLEIFPHTVLGEYKLHIPRQGRIFVTRDNATIRFVGAVTINGNHNPSVGLNAPSNNAIAINADNTVFDGGGGLEIYQTKWAAIVTNSGTAVPSIANDCTIKNLTIRECWRFGVQFNGCVNTVVDNVTIRDMEQSDSARGIESGNNAQNIQVWNTTTERNRDGCHVEHSQGVTFRNVTSRDNTRQGLLFLTCDDVHIEDCEITGASAAGIQIENNCQGFHIVGNEIHGNNTYEFSNAAGEAGIWVDDSVGGIVEHNDIYNNSSGIRVDGDGTVAATSQQFSEQVVVRLNKVHDNNSHAITKGDVYAVGFRGADKCYIYNNTFWGNGLDHAVSVGGNLGHNGGMVTLPEKNDPGPPPRTDNPHPNGQENTNLAFLNNVLGNTKTFPGNPVAYQIDLHTAGAEWGAGMDHNVYYLPPNLTAYKLGMAPGGFNFSNYQLSLVGLGLEQNSTGDVDPEIAETTMIPDPTSPLLNSTSVLVEITGSVTGTAIFLDHPGFFKIGDTVEFEDGSTAVVTDIPASYDQLVFASVPGSVATGQWLQLYGLVHKGAVQNV